MFINEISRTVANQIDNDEWKPDWNDYLDKTHVLIKENSRFKLWIGISAEYCRMYMPYEYDPFGYFGGRLVHKAALRCVKRSKINHAKKELLNKQLAGDINESP